jgi:LmbE family N-acetylglucosaminyl deacetylase
MTETVLVVAAHADDEALGCGGTLARHAAENDSVHAVFIADGVSSRIGATADDQARRRAAADKASSILGIRSTSYFDLPDNRLDGGCLLDIVQRLEELLKKIKPEVVYTHHCGDLNVDHRVAHQAVLTACRPLPGSSVKQLLAFEVLSSTEWNSYAAPPFLPTVYVDISSHLETKMRALEAYAAEMRDVPHSRSIAHARVLAQHRGFCVGTNAAEAFMPVRILR